MPSSRPFPQAYLPLFAATSLGACDPGPLGSAAYTVRDSASVEIVESTAPAWIPGEEWTVSENPVLHIGVVDGPDEYQFTVVTGVFEQTDGRIVVGDWSGEVRFYDEAGVFLGAFGREGLGPGEFGQLSWVRPYRGDSIFTWDQRGRRVSIFDRDGDYARSLMFPMPPRPEPSEGSGMVMWSPGGVADVADDGTLIGSSGVVARGEPGGRAPAQTNLVRYTPEGDSLQTLGPFEAEMAFPDFDRPVRLSGPYPRPFLSAVKHGGVFIAGDRGFDIEEVSFEAGLERVIRAFHVDLTLTDEHREMYAESERQRLAESAEPGAIESALLEVEYPETIPPSSQLLVDSEGHLWVRHYKIRWTPGPELWSVFSPEGFLLGVVETPELLQVRQIGPDFLLGIWTDDLEVRYIRKYALAR